MLGTVKSFFGSRGVTADGVMGVGQTAAWYALINNKEVRNAVISGAAERFGYDLDQVELRLYVGKFAGGQEPRIREWCENEIAGVRPISVIGAREVVSIVREVAKSTTYRDHPVLATLKVLDATNSLV